MNKRQLKLIYLFCMYFVVSLPTGGYEVPNSKTLLINQQNPRDIFKLFIYKPNSPAPEKGYPVIYILDGNSVFLSLTDEVRRKVALKYGQPAVVVAIGYPHENPWVEKRKNDLTFWPENYQQSSTSPAQSVQESGGEKLFNLIKTKIIPTIESQYNIDPKNRTLAGHSLGGLFTLHVLFQQTGLFENYAIASPSIWYANEQIFSEFEKYAKKFQQSPDSSKLLLMVGSCEETVGECDPHRQHSAEYDIWLTETGKMVTNTKIMFQKLSKLKGDNASLLIFEGENHASVIAPMLSWTATLAMTSKPE